METEWLDTVILQELPELAEERAAIQVTGVMVALKVAVMAPQVLAAVVAVAGVVIPVDLELRVAV